MSATNNGGPAFPRVPTLIEYSSGEVEFYSCEEGMSLRDYFAAAAIPALIQRGSPASNPHVDLAHEAYRIADEMLKAAAK
jgi:hypothetical protein